MAVEKKRKIIPVVYLLGSLILMGLLQYFLPVYQYLQPPLVYAGVVFVFLGIVILAVSADLFVKADTGLLPFEDATTLVTGGLYRFTRNPMYLGMFLMAFGAAFLLGSIGALIPLLAFMLIIRYNFVAGEERFMEAAFGQQYLDYKSNVRRWI
jgi:protein-S-isoprenylcysteine O-methyltransferase Ste14